MLGAVGLGALAGRMSGGLDARVEWGYGLAEDTYDARATSSGYHFIETPRLLSRMLLDDVAREHASHPIPAWPSYVKELRGMSLEVGREVQADCMCIVYLCVPVYTCVCYRWWRCKLTAYV